VSPRPNLVALPGYADRPEPDVLFCAHCGSHAPDGATPLTRVCGDCGLGLLVGAAPSLAPQPGEAFLLVDGQLAIREMSREAQPLLGVTESEALNLRVTDALMPADCEVDGVESLVNLLVHAARGEAEEGAARIVVRPAREFGIRLWARVGPCGPPRGALVVLREDAPR
jgi:hypothetical protein